MAPSDQVLGRRAHPGAAVDVHPHLTRIVHLLGAPWPPERDERDALLRENPSPGRDAGAPGEASER